LGATKNKNMHQLYDRAFLFMVEPVESYNNSMVGIPDTTVRIYADTSVFGGVFDEEFYV